MDKFTEVVRIVEALRGEDGCPWDRAQDHDSIKPYLIEETYEVLDAIDSKDTNRLKEELGDLILQIIFHAQIAKEMGAFDINDVLAHLGSKLKVRHPHVFADLKVSGVEDVLKNWERIKLGEREGGYLSGIPKRLPALLLARRIQDKLDRKGKTHRIEAEYIEERLKGLMKSLSLEKREGLEEEFGEILFLLVELARKEGIDAEGALRKRVMRFFKDASL
jgi:tetrapyrrole methylase family protein/MazG family protein